MLKPSLEDRKRYIADIATDIFLEKGYSSASLQDIAEAVGVSKAGLYHYFKSKESILYYILMTDHEENLQVVEEVREELLAPGQDPETILKNGLRLYARLSLKNRKLRLLSLRERHQFTESNREAYFEKEREVFDTLKSLLLNIPVLKKQYDLNAITFMIIGMNVWVGYWLKEGGESTLEDIIEQNIDVICHGILQS